MSQLDVVTFGEAMAMFVAKEPGELSEVAEFTRKAAGAELNVAIGLARLGFKVGWVSSVRFAGAFRLGCRRYLDRFAR